METKRQDLQVVMLQADDLKPYENNPRINDKAVEAVANSIQKFGFRQALVIDQNNVIVCGHTRWKAAKKLGIQEVPCFRAEDLTEEEIRAYRLADNKTAELAEWNLDLLDYELEALEGFDMTEFGFQVEEMDAEVAVEDNYEPVLPPEPKSKTGEIYQLGNHRLMVGDSTNAYDVQQLCDGDIMDLVVTDPPYNINIGITDIEEAKRRKRRLDGKTIQNDAMSDEEFYEFLDNAFANIAEHLKPGGAFYIWLASSTMGTFLRALSEHDLTVRQHLIWVKNFFTLGRPDYQWIHEPCLYGWKSGAGHYFIKDRTQTTVIEEDPIDLSKMKKDDMRKLLEKILGEQYTTVMREPKPKRSELHPTMKPIKLIAKQVQNSSRPREKVLDLFGGSGSTLIACEQINRVCYMMEYDPQYADAIIDRWEKFTGREAVLLNGID